MILGVQKSGVSFTKGAEAMLYQVPIEPYENRYSGQWNRWFPACLERHSIPYRTIEPRAALTRLDDRQVLVPIETQLVKARQLKQIVSLLREGEIADHDALLFHTLWFEGLEALQYIRDVAGIKFSIVGVLHAGSYDPNDFRVRLGMARWAQHIERGWLEFVDRIFVGSDYHKHLITTSLPIDGDKVIVTRLPIESREYAGGPAPSERENAILFPHRAVPEKNPELVERLREKLPQFPVVRTRDVTSSRSEYLAWLRRTKVAVSGSWQETFGYAMLEAALCGCVPLVPNRLCYREMYPRKYRYDSESELIDMIKHYMEHAEDVRAELAPLIDECEGAIMRMVRAIPASPELALRAWAGDTTDAG